MKYFILEYICFLRSFLRKQNNFFFFSVEDKKTYSRKELVVLSLFSWAEFQFMIEWRWGKPFCKRCIKQIEALVIWYACSIRFSNKIINYSCCKSQSVAYGDGWSINLLLRSMMFTWNVSSCFIRERKTKIIANIAIYLTINNFFKP